MGKKSIFENDYVLIPPPDMEAIKKEHCLCFSCEHNGICKYRSKFIEQQQLRFPEMLGCYKYEPDAKEI